MTLLKPFSLATVTHWVVFKWVGLKSDGSVFPVPHSESVNVLGPKWRKSAISESCHESCWDDGIGRMGIGGGVGKDDVVLDLDMRSVMMVNVDVKIVLMIFICCVFVLGRLLEVDVT